MRRRSRIAAASARSSPGADALRRTSASDERIVGATRNARPEPGDDILLCHQMPPRCGSTCAGRPAGHEVGNAQCLARTPTSAETAAHHRRGRSPSRKPGGQPHSPIWHDRKPPGLRPSLDRNEPPSRRTGVEIAYMQEFKKSGEVAPVQRQCRRCASLSARPTRWAPVSMSSFA